MGLYITGGILLLLAAALCTPLRLLVDYHEALIVTARWAFLRFELFPLKEEEEPPEPKQEPKPKEKPAKKKQKPKRPLTARDLLDYAGLAKELLPQVKQFFGFLTRHVVVDRLCLTVVVSGNDAADTGILFGKLGAGVYSTLAMVQNIFKVRPPQQINLYPDFVNGENRAEGSVRISLAPWVALWGALRLATALLMKYWNMKHQKPKEAS